MNEERKPSPLPAISRWERQAPALGCAGGGCFLPLVLYLACAIVLRDAGGPLIWPIAFALFGFVGLLIGLFVRAFSGEE